MTLENYNNRIIELPVTPEIIEWAKVAADRLGKLENSITDGAGSLVGYIGKGLVAKYFGIPLKQVYLDAPLSYDKDFHVLEKGISVKVHTKKITAGYTPQLDYECTICGYNPKQECDWYVFVRVSSDLTKGWIVGCSPKDEFFQKADPKEMGHLDIVNMNVAKSKKFDVLSQELRDIDEILPEHAPRLQYFYNEKYPEAKLVKVGEPKSEKEMVQKTQSLDETEAQTVAETRAVTLDTLDSTLEQMSTFIKLEGGQTKVLDFSPGDRKDGKFDMEIETGEYKGNPTKRIRYKVLDVAASKDVKILALSVKHTQTLNVLLNKGKRLIEVTRKGSGIQDTTYIFTAND